MAETREAKFVDVLGIVSKLFPASQNIEIKIDCVIHVKHFTE
jgi:hypothetical protein